MTGRWIALATVFIFAGIVTLAITFRPTRSGSGTDDLDALIDAPDLNPDSITDLGTGAGRGMTINIADRRDPSRLAGMLMCEKMDPLASKQYALTEPRAWIYLKDGRSIHIRADRAMFSMPEQNQSPDEGEFIGNVVLRMFDASLAGTSFDPQQTPAILQASTPRLSFVNDRGEMWTNDTLIVSTPDYEFTGSDVRIIFNQLRERLQLLEVRKGGTIRYASTKSKSNPLLTQDNAISEQGTASSALVATDDAPRLIPRIDQPAPQRSAQAEVHISGSMTLAGQTLYHAIFGDHVTAEQLDRVVTADQLDVWARVVDNKLPDDAISPIRTALLNHASTQAQTQQLAWKPAPQMSPLAMHMAGLAIGATQDDSSTEADPATNELLSLTPFSEDDGVLSWNRTLVIRPVLGEQTPAELREDHLAFAFTSPRSRVVQFEDPASSMSGFSAAITYAATRSFGVLKGDDETDVLIHAGSGMSAHAGQIEMMLSTGVGHIPTAGELIANSQSADKPDKTRSIRWNEQADFMLYLHDGALTQQLKMASFSGDTLATDGKASITSEFLLSEFDQGQSPVLTKMLADGSVIAKREDKSLASDHLEVFFKPRSLTNPDAASSTMVDAQTQNQSSDANLKSSGKVDPYLVVAQGNVRAAQEHASITTHDLRADLILNDKNRVVVSHVIAKAPAPSNNTNPHDSTPGVIFNRDDGVYAQTDYLEADTIKQIATLLGTGSSVAKGPTRVTGEQIYLNGKDQAIEVFGQGQFSHRSTSNSDRVTDATANWSRRMTYSDATGLAECLGDVVVTSEPDDLTEDRISADRVIFEIAQIKDDQTTHQMLDDEPLNQRKLVRAHAFGSILQTSDGRPVDVTSIRYVHDETQPTGRRQERLMTLRGARVFAENTQGTLEVPDAGVLVLYDATPEDADENPAGEESSELSQASTRGQTLFRWDGSMLMERRIGQMRMLNNVRMIHQPLGDQDSTQLECEMLTATMPQDSQDNYALDAPINSQIHRVTAEGAAWMRNGPREIVADQLTYDALTKKVEALAEAGERVTFFDAQRGATTTGKKLIWDLMRDRVQLLGSEATAMPR